MLSKYKTTAKLKVQDMVELSFPNLFFDAVVDVFSSYCLPKSQGGVYLSRVAQILKPGGIFFSYFPSKRSDTYQYPENATWIDSDTLSSILRKDAPFYGQLYPVRFIHPREYEKALTDLGFQIQYSEVVTRTHHNRKELSEFVVIEAKKV